MPRRPRKSDCPGDLFDAVGGRVIDPQPAVRRNCLQPLPGAAVDERPVPAEHFVPRHFRPAVVVGIARKRPGAAGVALVGLQGQLGEQALGGFGELPGIAALAIEIAEEAVVPIVHRGDGFTAVANDPQQLSPQQIVQFLDEGRQGVVLFPVNFLGGQPIARAAAAGRPAMPRRATPVALRDDGGFPDAGPAPAPAGTRRFRPDRGCGRARSCRSGRSRRRRTTARPSRRTPPRAARVPGESESWRCRSSWRRSSVVLQGKGGAAGRRHVQAPFNFAWRAGAVAGKKGRIDRPVEFSIT